MKKSITYFLLLNLFLYSCTGKINHNKYPYQDAGLSVENRVTDLIGRMTIDEKIHQLDMYWGREVANMNGHEASSYSEEKIEQMIGNIGIGSIHDFYPLRAEITNEIQKYALEKTRL